MRRAVLAASVAALFAGGCGSDTALMPGHGMVVVQLTDAPFPTDSVQSVDIYVMRVDGRLAAADEAEAGAAMTESESKLGGWTTLATPDASIDLLTLQHGTTTTLGQVALPAGSYSGFRLIIDPSRSSVTLKNGTKLDGSSDPGVTFPSASHSGLKIQLSSPVVIADGGTTTMVVDFDVANSFVLRGSSLTKNGLLFKPTIKATVK